MTRIVVRNEFAQIEVEQDDDESLLRIRDVKSGQEILLDALELESLAWCLHEQLNPILDPSATRWPSRWE